MPSTSGIQNTTKLLQIGINTSDNSTESSSDEEYKCPVLTKQRKFSTPKSQQMRCSLTQTAKMADLTGTSNRAVAKIVYAVLEDFKIISREDQSNVIDKSKIRRELSKNRKKLQQQLENKDIKGLYFDGRKDQTICIKNSKKTIQQEEHITILKEPGCDGTNVNTGWKGGIIRLIENDIKRPLQWCICLLHANELPLRHLLQSLDGDTKGPYSFLAPIGALLKHCQDMPIVQFKPINTSLPQLEPDDLSTDQQYLYKICIGIQNGTITPNLAMIDPGKMSHARWLTTANRVLLYIATKNPSPNLVIFTEFILKVYAPVWFEIKTKQHICDGARYLWKSINASRGFPDNVEHVIDKVFADNAYFAHPENILLAMLTDPRSYIRELAARRIKKCRMQTNKTVRVFRVPFINLDADDYTSLIDCQKTITEPPLTFNVTNEVLDNIVSRKEVLNFEKFPCHTQAVERCVKLVTEASTKMEKLSETQNSSDIPSDIEGKDERSKVVEKLNSAIPTQTKTLSVQKASTSITPQIVHFENQFTTPKVKTKNKNNTNMEQDSESTQVLHMMKSMYEKRERDEYDVFGEMVAHNIRSLRSEYLKITVQQQITSVLFDADV
ncbi:unnamed protein product [Brassicogethes aeneus]|uniref:Uncharacterized protein n=1 Tax=Brassicogethes aeneus TaxID=1431903 RepID=A0A9P0BGS6_BRAAE|nr:unnamed protein product [Brassicogethes aeneus]